MGLGNSEFMIMRESQYLREGSQYDRYKFLRRYNLLRIRKYCPRSLCSPLSQQCPFFSDRNGPSTPSKTSKLLLSRSFHWKSQLSSCFKVRLIGFKLFVRWKYCVDVFGLFCGVGWVDMVVGVDQRNSNLINKLWRVTTPFWHWSTSTPDDWWSGTWNHWRKRVYYGNEDCNVSFCLVHALSDLIWYGLDGKQESWSSRTMINSRYGNLDRIPNQLRVK